MMRVSLNPMLVVTLAVALTATELTAQSREKSITGTAKAEALESQAVSLYGTPRSWQKAARLHEQAASLRGAADARAVYDLQMAGRLFYYTGDLIRSRHAMERAANRAIAMGDVYEGAKSLVAAAHIAIKQKRSNEARVFATRAETLLSSPLLTSEQRADIQRQIGAASSVASRN